MNPRSIVRHASILLLALAAASAAGCSDDAADGAEDGQGGGADDGGDDGPDPKPAACPKPTKGPTQHDFETIEDGAEVVWSADASPHIVKGFAVVRGGAKLTIEPCATVQFVDENSGITIAYPSTPNTGEIVAEGTAEQPIVLEGQGGARWAHIGFAPGGKGSFAHVTMSNGGAFDERGATLVVSGDRTFPTKHDVRVDHVTIEGSRGSAVVLENLGAFTADSTDLVITGSGKGDDAVEAYPYPIVLDEHALLTLPRGTYTGNAVDAVYVSPEFSLRESGTMKNVGVPYHVGGFGADHFVVGAGPDTAFTTLTIEPGTTIAMYPGTAFDVEFVSSEEPASGAVIAEGTAAEPIVFTSQRATPAAGDWQGLQFGGVASAENSFRHVRIEYSGADCGCILIGCSDIEGYEGAIIFGQQPPSAFFQDTVIAHGAGNGVVLGYRGNLVDVAAGITFEDLAWCPQTQPHPGSCPNPLPGCQ
jgi:hypothetical protein